MRAKAKLITEKSSRMIPYCLTSVSSFERMSAAKSCMHTKTSHLVSSSWFPTARFTHHNIISSLGMSSILLLAPAHLSRTDSMSQLYCRNILNIHPFWYYRDMNFSAHVKSFMDIVPGSGCIDQPLTHGLGRNVNTPVSFDNVLKKSTSNKKHSRHPSCKTHIHYDTYECHRVAHSDHMA